MLANKSNKIKLRMVQNHNLPYLDAIYLYSTLSSVSILFAYDKIISIHVGDCKKMGYKNNKKNNFEQKFKQAL